MDLKTQDKILQGAAYFVKKSQEEPGKGLDALKLQKLLYYAQAWNLALSGKRLFPDEFQAWVHGPANHKVWHEFREFNFNAPHPEFLAHNLKFTSDELSVLESVWMVYGKFDGKYLETLTHNEDPWQLARKDLSPKEASKNVISDEVMKLYYGQRLKEEEHSSKGN